MSDWIKPIDRLPEDGQDVLISTIDGAVYDGGINSPRVTLAMFVSDPLYAGTWYSFFTPYGDDRAFLVKEVLAWMPLPEPYEEGEEE